MDTACPATIDPASSPRPNNQNKATTPTETHCTKRCFYIQKESSQHFKNLLSHIVLQQAF